MHDRNYIDLDGKNAHKIHPTTGNENKDTDMVNHPPHYNVGGIETLDIIEASMSREAFKGYLLGNVIKYRERAEHKGNPEQDYAKAQFYWNKRKELDQ